MIEKERIHVRNDKPVQQGKFVLYWMQAAQRAEWNHALEYALIKANELHKPLLVFFGLTESFPEANLRHFVFMLEGLQETQKKLAQRGIKMVVLHGSPDTGVLHLARDAALVVTDRGYLKVQKQWREKVARELPCLFIEVESDVVVPVEVVSSHEEYSARTIRPKIRRNLNRFLTPLEETPVHFPSVHLPPIPGELDLSCLNQILSLLQIDTSVPPVSLLRGGTEEAKGRLATFLQEKLSLYASLRNDPAFDVLSGMSPYLHFGQISPLFIAWKVQKTQAPEVHKEAYLEELIVRRELAINFIHYNPQYDSFQGLPEWARETLKRHAQDPRPYLYPLEVLESATTHDPLWNAAQRELVVRGTIHGYVRMYWGKKILEWTKDPEEAFAIALYLNNKYALDGRDPNSFTGVAWCFGKHDRPFPERPVYGKVRPMTRGAPSKISQERYVQRILFFESSSR
ncbi:MAG: deoxyribodipyrimidine photo-lyase [Candidatus Caldatribacterium sp.]|uniref:deoxyribodipyrimidine photo-lyase n=1 Tax=Candidatus Caldatribacterium sp. TaxID=2282143 RepID=UPI0029992D94|nr:deoxyribodipyrimidine photo-lyase [Candidatus Caldatribacterium sp.]MCX7730486.1 deoxyribodipyrimidine photo-lyase [Candidatus Caldatribacterium sp.]MDW8081624.1 deoxyribodipyrimidine photo-lyase [Candidatus Calescibacterium sp.]